MDFVESLKGALPKTELEALFSSLKEEPRHCVLLNPCKITAEEFLAKYPHVTPHPFVPNAFYYEKSEYDLGKSFLYDVGALSIEDASAMLVPFLLDPKPNETVLDFCAAPGGKTAAMSFLMQGQGILLANDISYPRAKALSSNVERLGLGNVIVSANDFSSLFSSFTNVFDKILLDAPCSGSAMFRKNELAKELWSMQKVKECAKTQSSLLEMAATMLKPGGRLAYSTCSFSMEENEGVILNFLAGHPDFHPVPSNLDSPSFFHHESLKEGIHLYPHRFQGEGQFVVLLEKEGSLCATKAKAMMKLPSKYLDFTASYKLESRCNFLYKDAAYSLPCPFDFSKLQVLRPGVKLFEVSSIPSPDFALARYLDSGFALALTEEQAKRYCAGEQIPYPGKDGYALFAYANKTIGWAKLSKGQAKNHYPKGLRHRYTSL